VVTRQMRNEITSARNRPRTPYTLPPRFNWS
jgi:hypothetical protein